MVKKTKTQKGFIQIPLLIAIIISVAVISAGGYGGFEYYKISKLVKEADQFTEKEEYGEAIWKLELAQDRWFTKELSIKEEEISDKLKKNIRFLEDNLEYNKAIEEFEKENWQEAIDLFSKISEDFPHYQSSQLKIEETEREIEKEKQEEQSSEVEKLKEEIEALKKQKEQTKLPSLKFPTLPETKTESDDYGKKVFNEWSKRIVQVTCYYGSFTKKGSGTIFYKQSADAPFVVTNAHLILKENECMISVPSPIQDGKFYNYIAFGVPNVEDDFAFFFLTDEVIEIGGVTQRPIGDSPPPSTLTFTKNYKYCSPEDVQIGDKVYILGFPTIGGSSLTMTEGIISGIEDFFYKTSAKIDQGNSGGVAILGEKNCYLGIPTYAKLTYAKLGGVESLGYILNLTILKEGLEDW